MKLLKTGSIILLIALAGLLPACQSTPSRAPGAQAISPELLQTNYLYEIVRYLYRWQLDDSEIQGIIGEKKFIFWVRPEKMELDPDDHSKFAEILFPQLNLAVNVKKGDYTVEELGTDVKSGNFKISHITRGLVPKRQPPDCTAVTVDMQEMRDYLFRTRNEHGYPDPTLVKHLREAVHEEAAKEGILDTNLPTGEQIINVAPLSPVANEAWVFWEAGHRLLYVASDIDLDSPAVWKEQALSVHIYDLDQQVVVTHEEAPGSNRFLTRYEVGRALYNCITLGQLTVVPPYSPSNAPPGFRK